MDDATALEISKMTSMTGDKRKRSDQSGGDKRVSKKSKKSESSFSIKSPKGRDGGDPKDKNHKRKSKKMEDKNNNKEPENQEHGDSHETPSKTIVDHNVNPYHIVEEKEITMSIPELIDFISSPKMVNILLESKTNIDKINAEKEKESIFSLNKSIRDDNRDIITHKEVRTYEPQMDNIIERNNNNDNNNKNSASYEEIEKATKELMEKANILKSLLNKTKPVVLDFEEVKNRIPFEIWGMIGFYVFENCGSLKEFLDLTVGFGKKIRFYFLDSFLNNSRAKTKCVIPKLLDNTTKNLFVMCSSFWIPSKDFFDIVNKRTSTASTARLHDENDPNNSVWKIGCLNYGNKQYEEGLCLDDLYDKYYKKNPVDFYGESIRKKWYYAKTLHVNEGLKNLILFDCNNFCLNHNPKSLITSTNIPKISFDTLSLTSFFDENKTAVCSFDVNAQLFDDCSIVMGSEMLKTHLNESTMCNETYTFFLRGDYKEKYHEGIWELLCGKSLFKKQPMWKQCELYKEYIKGLEIDLKVYYKNKYPSGEDVEIQNLIKDILAPTHKVVYMRSLMEKKPNDSMELQKNQEEEEDGKIIENTTELTNNKLQKEYLIYNGSTNSNQFRKNMFLFKIKNPSSKREKENFNLIKGTSVNIRQLVLTRKVFFPLE